MKIVVLILACLVFICGNTGCNGLRLRSARVKGIDRLTFVCKFRTSYAGYVTWYLNGFEVEDFPHFEITSKYKKKRNILISKLKVVRPEITTYGDNYTCVANDMGDEEEVVFQNVRGLTNQLYRMAGKYYSPQFTKLEGTRSRGIGKFYFDSDYNNGKFKYSVGNVDKICRKWNVTFVNNNGNRTVCRGKGCYCDGIKIFNFGNTVTEETKIKPVPFFKLNFKDYVNIPDYYNISLLWYGHNGEAFVHGIYDSVATIQDKNILPNTLYYIEVFWSHPFHKKDYSSLTRGYMRTTPRQMIDRNALRFSTTTYSSGLTPGRPGVLNATMDGDVCRVKIGFPANIDPKDTYEHFVPEIRVNHFVTQNFTRISDDVYEIKKDALFKYPFNYVSLRILSSEEKYHSDFSDILYCETGTEEIADSHFKNKD